jgi:HK97 family phage major capsid protein
MKLRELLDKRATLAQQARAILDKADSESRDLAAEEQQQWDALMNQVTSLGATIEREQRMNETEAELAHAPRESVRPEPEPDGRRNVQTRLEFVSRGLRNLNLASLDEPRWKLLTPFADETYRQIFATYIRRGVIPGAWRERTYELEAALQADLDAAGGYLVTPIQFVDRLVKAIDDMVFVRQWATIFAVPNAESLGVPSLDTDPADADWTSELATGSEDSSMAFGRRQLSPHPLAKRIKVSNKLLAKVPDSESLVRDRLAYKFGITFEKGCLTGSGANQPLGVFTASALGISTSRDVSTGNTTTSIQFDGLQEAKFTLKGQYWPRARWLFHRDGLKQIAKLQDDNGRYIWQESVREGEPDRLLGLPVFMSEYAPNTFTTGLYVGILGDFSNYWIADSMAMTLQRLVELYAETGQVGLIGRLESDGMPVLEEAFVRVKLA